MVFLIFVRGFSFFLIFVRDFSFFLIFVRDFSFLPFFMRFFPLFFCCCCFLRFSRSISFENWKKEITNLWEKYVCSWKEIIVHWHQLIIKIYRVENLCNKMHRKWIRRRQRRWWRRRRNGQNTIFTILKWSAR